MLICNRIQGIKRKANRKIRYYGLKIFIDNSINFLSLFSFQGSLIQDNDEEFDSLEKLFKNYQWNCLYLPFGNRLNLLYR